MVVCLGGSRKVLGFVVPWYYEVLYGWIDDCDEGYRSSYYSKRENGLPYIHNLVPNIHDHDPYICPEPSIVCLVDILVVVTDDAAAGSLALVVPCSRLLWRQLCRHLHRQLSPTITNT